MCVVEQHGAITHEIAQERFSLGSRLVRWKVCCAVCASNTAPVSATLCSRVQPPHFPVFLCVRAAAARYLCATKNRGWECVFSLFVLFAVQSAVSLALGRGSANPANIFALMAV